ncbi:MAG: lysine biosynthesis protein LysX [Thaumarchaeota archaeon]|nr:lysine biosynthesis protein LysX [Nitrososphaerota archaeon]
MPRLALLYDRIRWEEKELYRKAKEKGIELKLVDAKSKVADPYVGEEAIRRLYGDLVLQRCISHMRGLHYTAYLESMGLRVINSFKVQNLCGNKALTSLFLIKKGIPTPRTLLAFSQEAAGDAVERIGYPAVIKPVIGSWGRMVLALKDREVAQAILEMRGSMQGPFDSIFYIQEFVKRPPRDIRAIVVGDEVVSCIYRYAPSKDWRTNVARGGRAEVCPIDDGLEDLVLRVADELGGGVLGVDLMEGESGLLVHEVNSTVEFRGAASVSGRDIAGAILEYALKEAKR